MKKALISTLFAFAIVAVANAIVTQKLVLKDGSVLYGYIQQQDGKGKLTIHTDSALICLSGQKVDDIKPSQVTEMELTPIWKTWAENNDAYEETSSKKTLTLSKIFFKKDSIATQTTADVLVLEEGAVVKYLELTPNVYYVKWKDILTIQAGQRSKTDLSGIDRVYKLKNGATEKGQYAGETENLLKLFIGKMKVKSFDINDVVKYEYLPINPNQDIFAQSELLDVINTRSGEEVKGIIVEQNYEGKTNAENFFKVQTGKNPTQTREVKVSDIVEVRKADNPDYHPLKDILLDEDDVYVNRQKASWINVEEHAKDNDVLLLDSINADIVVALDAEGKATVAVEYWSGNNDGVKKFQLIRVSKKEGRKNDIYGFTYKDLATSNYPSTEPKTSVNHTTKVEFTLRDKGVHALYDAQKHKAITFRIK